MTCRVCPRPDREQIDAELLQGVPTRTIADQYGPSHQALLRHRPHIAERIVRAHDAAEIASGDVLAGKLRAIEGEARRLGQAAEKAGDLRAALQACRELVRCVELAAKLSGDLREGQVNVAVLQFDEAALCRAAEVFLSRRQKMIETRAAEP